MLLVSLVSCCWLVTLCVPTFRYAGGDERGTHPLVVLTSRGDHATGFLGLSKYGAVHPPARPPPRSLLLCVGMGLVCVYPFCFPSHGVLCVVALWCLSSRAGESTSRAKRGSAHETAHRRKVLFGPDHSLP
jgi:hypothetical protein